jgi:hypothetical protein
MPAQVTIASTVYQIVLPDGNRYQAGQVATLTDEQLGSISTGDASAWFSTITKFTPGAQTVTDPDAGLANSATALVSAAGAAVLGGLVGTAWNEVTAASIPAFVRDQADECSSGRSGMTAAGGFGTDAVDTTYTTPAPAYSNI